MEDRSEGAVGRRGGGFGYGDVIAMYNGMNGMSRSEVTTLENAYGDGKMEHSLLLYDERNRTLKAICHTIKGERNIALADKW